ncbi:MAG TPA: bifunctional 2-C-methyl-D-erythritol 4-phosphate cytidylyltransferase/2-C-methyl-D-erythritol 2,4-cyclodiphosphate synthase [Alphaproteobacteria bacterium]
MMDCVALVVAAGRGSRAGGDVPKQYRRLGAWPVLRWSLMRFANHPRVDGVCVVMNPDDKPLYDEATRGLDLLPPVPGGATRQESVHRGLESLVPVAPRHVLIHDAARPFVDDAIIDRTLDALATASGAIAAVPVADTLKRGADGLITGTVERTGLWRAQTPQAFRFADILGAHRAAIGAELSDDAAVAERAGLAVALVAGSEANGKLTTDDDIRRAERFAGTFMEPRTGTGYDVHAFGPGDHVWLCGVKVPHTQALVGHSDADVALHALTDAVLGAIGDGDIGQHFPPSDPRWRGAASAQFLAHAAGLVAARGGRIVHVDVTIVCERPKIGPHRAHMVARLAEILGIEASRCSVKATTTEGLGFTGRGEGIAAQAVATVVLPA